MIKAVQVFLIVFLFIDCKSIPHNKKNTREGFSIPKTLKHNDDKFIDSIFINVPSEGTKVKAFKKNNGKLYVFNSIASMARYNIEFLIKSDSSFFLKKTIEYNQPLIIPNAKVEKQSLEYLVLCNDSLLFFHKDGKQIKVIKDILEKKEEIKHLKGILIENMKLSTD